MNNIINLIREKKVLIGSSSYIGGGLTLHILDEILLEIERNEGQSVNIEFLKNHENIGNISVDLDGDLNEDLINVLRGFAKDNNLGIKILNN